MFFGRDDLLNRIQDRIENRKTRWICLYGQRRTGKTSIRNHSIKKLSQNEKNIIDRCVFHAADISHGSFCRSGW